MPKGFDSKLLDNIKNGLVMELVYTSKKTTKDSFKMECVAFEEDLKNIKTGDYQFMNTGDIQNMKD